MLKTYVSQDKWSFSGQSFVSRKIFNLNSMIFWFVFDFFWIESPKKFLHEKNVMWERSEFMGDMGVSWNGGFSPQIIHL